LSERCPKRSVIVAMKLAEILVMLGALVGFWMGSWPLLLTVLFVMGTQSAFFGPSKYGIVPELVERRGLLSANGVITMTTFLAILSGQAVAGPLLDHFPNALWIGGSVCVAIAILGTAVSLGITRTPATRPESRVGWNPFGGLFGTIGEMRADRRLFAIVIANSFFWFNGGVLQQAVTGMGSPDVLDLALDENMLISLLLVTLASSLMLGCIVAPIVGRRLPASRLLTLGVICMVGAQLLLTLVGPVFSRAEGGYLLAHVLLGVAGFSAAFFVVPIVSFVQDAPPEGKKGKTFAVNNFLNFLFIFLAGAFYDLISRLGLPPTVSTALASLILAGYVFRIRRVVRQVRL
jgi:acyl-[acyl-carrier-protein]-phospholipid O-acyltransferase/long-chain-fatty-acid--[acyl-carrier-protein] ligase